MCVSAAGTTAFRGIVVQQSRCRYTAASRKNLPWSYDDNGRWNSSNLLRSRLLVLRRHDLLPDQNGVAAKRCFWIVPPCSDCDEEEDEENCY
jgi:hypothetical protein